MLYLLNSPIKLKIEFMKSGSQQSWRSRLCSPDIPLFSTLGPAVDKENENLAHTHASFDKKPTISGGWKDAGRCRRDDLGSTIVSKESYTSSSSNRGDIVIKEGFLNCYLTATTLLNNCAALSVSPARGGSRCGGSTSLSMTRDEQKQCRGKWVQVFMSLTGSCLSIFPSKALADTRSAVPGSDASKPIAVTIYPATLIAAFSDHFEPGIIPTALESPMESSNSASQKKSVSPDPVAPEIVMPHGTAISLSGVPNNTKTATAQQSGRPHYKSSWGKTLLGLHVDGSASTSNLSSPTQMVFLSASEEGLLTQWLKVIQQWCAPTHYNRRLSVNNNVMPPRWLPFSSLLPISTEGEDDGMDHFCYADIIPASVWDLVLPLHPHHAFATKPTPTGSTQHYHRSPLASLTSRIANKKASKPPGASKSLSREKSKEPSAPPIRKKLIALKQATLKMNERLSSRMASRTSSAVNSLRCSTILQKSDVEDGGTDDEMLSSTCSAVVGVHTMTKKSRYQDPEDVESRHVGVSCNLGEQAASTTLTDLQSKLATLTSQNVSLETTNAKLSGKLIELENKVDVAEFERDSWMDKYHELLALTTKSE